MNKAVKYVRFLSVVIILLAALSFFSHGVKEVLKKDGSFGVFSMPFIKFINFPSTVLKVFNEIKSLEIYTEIDPLFEEKNDLSYDLFLLNSHFNSENDNWVIALNNMKNDKIVHEWTLARQDFLHTYRQFTNSDPRSPLLMPDRSLIVFSDESQNMYRLNSESEIIWHNTERIYHHSLNVGPDGNIWACSRNNVYSIMPDGRYVEYIDNTVAKIDANTGKTLITKSVSDILRDNELNYLIHGFGNSSNTKPGEDPLHLNDIEPCLSSTKYWEKGDLFLSLRNRSVIIQYRPASNKVLRVIHGAFMYQHDVDIATDSTLTIFNNNISGFRKFEPSEVKLKQLNDLELKGQFLSSQIVEYSFSDSVSRPVFKELFEEERISTNSQGLHTRMSNEDLYIESQNTAKIYIVNEEGVILRAYPNEIINGLTERPHWSRVYENIDF